MENAAIDAYQQLYDELPFEDIMAGIRKKTVLQFLNNRKVHTLLEIGCGNDSIVNHFTHFDNAIVVEPSTIFFDRLCASQSVKSKNVTFINDFFSAKLTAAKDFNKVDTVLISGLLHELLSPDNFLKEVFDAISSQTAIHINVPNANSFHRLLAVEAGLIKNVNELSPLQQKLKQPSIFSLASLEKMLTNCGFKIVEKGTYFIKPFTHLQMQHIKNNDLFSSEIINGLEKMIKYFPENGAEIFMNVVKE